jgi:orotate phosphoribosyltransferase
MSENSNISTLVLKNDSTLSKKKDSKYYTNANNTISQPKIWKLFQSKKNLI